MAVFKAQYAANNIGISGFKYVLGPEVSMLRRFVWLLIILLASAWMIWNIQGRVSYFLSRPSAITTQMKFKDKLMFPKVTICNQNTFRSSKVFNEMGVPRTSPSLYEAIDRYLQVLHEDNGRQFSRRSVVEKYGKFLSDRNVVEFYRRVAHQKSALFQRCTWKGRKCGPENFTEVFTNMGVCYQFNADDMIVEKANKDGGLSLMLFVEQYDYMRDPHTSSGALVVISHHNETESFAKEQGIGLTVGQSVSIGLQQSEVIDLPHPYSSCASKTLNNYPPDNPYTYQKCHLDCLTSFIKTKCGCTSLYMPGQDMPNCNLLRNLECVIPNEELFYQTEQINACNCSSSCNSITYSPSMSLVQFSISFKQSLALAKPPVSVSDINRAINIQTWGLFNTIDADITDCLAHMATLFVDFRNTWHSYSSAVNVILMEVNFLMNAVLEHNLTESLMMEIKPDQEAAVTWKGFEEVIGNISDVFVYCDIGFSFDIQLQLGEDNQDELDVRLAKEIVSESDVYFELFDLREMFERSVEYFLRDSELLLNFTSVATAELKHQNISTWNRASTQDISDLVSHMAHINQAFFDYAEHMTDYQNEFEVIKEVIQKNYYTLTSGFYSDNVLKLDIYFKDLGVQESKKEPAYSIEGLVCDIGGSIGLCLGGWERALAENVARPPLKRSVVGSILLSGPSCSLGYFPFQTVVHNWFVKGRGDIGGSIGLCLGGSVLTLFEFFDILAILFGRRNRTGDLPLSEKKTECQSVGTTVVTQITLQDYSTA